MSRDMTTYMTPLESHHRSNLTKTIAKQKRIDGTEQKHLFTSHNTAHKKGHIAKAFAYIESVCEIKG